MPKIRDLLEVLDQVRNHLVHGRELRKVDTALLHEFDQGAKNLCARERRVMAQPYENADDVDVAGMAIQHDQRYGAVRLTLRGQSSRVHKRQSSGLG